MLPTVIVAAVAATAGYMMGRHSDKADVAPPQKTPPAGVNWKAKSKDAGEKSDLALKSDGEAAKHIPALTETTPEAPPVVLLNPGTSDPKGNVRDPATTRVNRSAVARAAGNEGRRTDTGDNKPRDERAEGSRNSMRDYSDLREYMLGR